jgi:GNAT superfamily N-acetyltransferase
MVVLEDVPFDAARVQALLAECNGEFAITIPGFSPAVGLTVDALDFQPPNGVFLLATLDEDPVGCGGLRLLTAQVGEIKRLFVRRLARGQGIARTLLGGLEDRARDRGFKAIRLDTHGGEPSAVGLFRAAGYQPIADYNGNPYARYWFEKRLTR